VWINLCGAAISIANKKVETFVLLSQGVASNLIIRKQQQPTYIRDVKTKGL
jgi:hypothetical protein